MIVGMKTSKRTNFYLCNKHTACTVLAKFETFLNLPLGGIVEKKNLSPVFGVSTLIKLSDAFNDENANDVRP